MKTNRETLISVAVVDDHKILVDGLKHIIEDSGVAHVIGQAYSITECYKMLETCQPEVLMLDVSLPDGNGIDICAELLAKHTDMEILMLTSYAESAVVARAIEEGAKGYVLKNAMSEEIIEGICQVAAGNKFLCEEAKDLLNKNNEPHVTLSSREKEILALIVEGLTIKEMSDKLFLGYETVRSYCKYLHLKLGVHNTASLVRKAIEQKLI